MTWLGRGLDSLPLLSGLSAYFGEYDSVDLEAAFEYWRGLRPAAGAAGADVVRLYLYLPVLLIGPPTLMAGVSFPLLQRIVQTDLSQIGRRVGVLFTANVLGSTAGAFVTGLLLLDWLGTPGTLTFLFVVSLAFLLSGISQFLPGTGRRRLLAYAACGLVATLVAVNVPTGRTLWGMFWSAPRG